MNSIIPDTTSRRYIFPASQSNQPAQDLTSATQHIRPPPIYSPQPSKPPPHPSSAPPQPSQAYSTPHHRLPPPLHSHPHTMDDQEPVSAHTQADARDSSVPPPRHPDRVSGTARARDSRRRRKASLGRVYWECLLSLSSSGRRVASLTVGELRIGEGARGLAFRSLCGLLCRRLLGGGLVVVVLGRCVWSVGCRLLLGLGERRVGGVEGTWRQQWWWLLGSGLRMGECGLVGSFGDSSWFGGLCRQV